MFRDEDIVRIRNDLPAARIIVITPYEAQRHVIEQTVKQINFDITVGTIDGFQGQEADIVLLSLVTTKGDGQFVGERHRINVALTRAKFVLRIVGCLGFFQRLKSLPLLHKLSESCRKKRCVKPYGSGKKHRELAWIPLNWQQAGKWKPRCTARFYSVLQKLASPSNKYLALNTVVLISIPDLNTLAPQKQGSEMPCWQFSRVNHQDAVCIVWAPKEGDILSDREDDRRPIVEAHFVGTRKKCLQFIQNHPNVPRGTRRVKKNLDGIEPILEGADQLDMVFEARDLVAAWNMTPDICNAVLDDRVVPLELPAFSFELDPHQIKILRTEPPLLLESRSGTGKTIVLFQYAIAYARKISSRDTKPIIFITVSQTLRNELEERYRQVEEMEEVSLPTIQFLSLRKFLDGLLSIIPRAQKRMPGGTMGTCSYLGRLVA